MIYTVIADFKRIEYLFCENGAIDTDGAEEVFSFFPKEIREIIAKTTNKRTALQRAGAYLTLYNTLRHFLDKDEIVLSKREGGKPCLLTKDKEKEINIRISLSHCDTLAAVSICDCCEVGVDIEEKIDGEREKRLRERFFRNVSEVKCEEYPVYLMATLTENLTSIFAEIPNDKLQRANADDFSAKWTRCEAAMKCDGRGFSAVDEIDDIIEASSIDSRCFKYRGKEYYISTAVKI